MLVEGEGIRSVVARSGWNNEERNRETHENAEGFVVILLHAPKKQHGEMALGEFVRLLIFPFVVLPIIIFLAWGILHHAPVTILLHLQRQCPLACSLYIYTKNITREKEEADSSYAILLNSIR